MKRYLSDLWDWMTETVIPLSILLFFLTAAVVVPLYALIRHAIVVCQ